jgi:hypothetical protein
LFQVGYVTGTQFPLHRGGACEALLGADGNDSALALREGGVSSIGIGIGPEVSADDGWQALDGRNKSVPALTTDCPRASSSLNNSSNLIGGGASLTMGTGGIMPHPKHPRCALGASQRIARVCQTAVMGWSITLSLQGVLLGRRAQPSPPCERLRFRLGRVGCAGLRGHGQGALLTLERLALAVTVLA